MPRPSTGNGLAITDLERMLDQRRNEVSRLHKRRAEVERELFDLNKKINKLEGRGGGGRTRGGGRGSRPRNAQSLGDAIEAFLRENGGAKSVGGVMEGVLATGYRSSSPSFRGIVNQALIKDERFEKTGRGLYQLKKSKKVKSESND